LESLEKTLAPLKQGQQGNLKEVEKAVKQAEKEWAGFLEKERKRTWELERPKLVKRRKDAAEAQVEEIKSRWSEGIIAGEAFDGRWKRVKRVVERAIVEGGATADLDSSEATTGKAGWKSILKEEIEGLDAQDRKKYVAARNSVESDISRLRKAADGSVEEAERPEVSLHLLLLPHCY